MSLLKVLEHIYSTKKEWSSSELIPWNTHSISLVLFSAIRYERSEKFLEPRFARST